MQITINNQLMEVEADLSLETLLGQLGLLAEESSQGVALAVNRKIISRSQWVFCQLNHGDEITLIKATAGG
ncbi:sulfur carrier protein ThiS [uncultured Endozoicomonas sp.]|uniref:sulfur carrier protein ThiS n=1 Tax=uncultured Endozoicomonas sp. TaxID=432652 RepID=UPI00260D5747|nr:sulfur carrier protein ThiS [uncultured Endozoicomonas sp.]